MAKPRSKAARQELAAQPEGDAPYVNLTGMPFDTPTNGELKSKAELPFACRRCMYPLQVLQSHTLARGGHTKVLCLGTCLEALKGNPEALQELGLESPEQLCNAFAIPDGVVAKAVGYSLEKGELIDATNDLAERAQLHQGEEEAEVLAGGGLQEHGAPPVRDGGPGPQAAA